MGWAPTSREAGEGLGTGGRGGRGPVLSVEAGLGQGWEKRGERDGRRGRSTARERLSRWQSSRMEEGPLPEGPIPCPGAQPSSCDEARH